MEVILIRHFLRDFVKQLKKMDRSGGNQRTASDQIKKALGELALGVEPTLNTTHNGEQRIPHCVKYDLSGRCRWVTIQNQGYLFPIYAGDHEEVDEWIDNHRNLRLKIDKSARKIFAIWDGESRQTQYTTEFLEASKPQREAILNENSDEVTRLTESNNDIFEKILEEGDYNDWLIYLNDRQIKLVNESNDLPIVLSGVSGSGKTCILVHRACRLARNPSASICIVTLNRDLAELLKILVNKVSPSASNIKVMPFYECFKLFLNKPSFGVDKYLSAVARRVQPMQGDRIAKIIRRRPNFLQELMDFEPGAHFRPDEEGPNMEKTWREFVEHANNRPWISQLKEFLVGEGKLGEEAFLKYLRDEISLIRSTFPIRERFNGYQEMERKGRTISIERGEQREWVLKLVDQLESDLIFNRISDPLVLTQAMSCLDEDLERLDDSSKFDYMLIDEFQDLSTLDMIVLQKLIRPGKDNLFLVGDRAQQIYVKSLNLPQAGLGRDRRQLRYIRKNYRNSSKILQAGYKIIQDFQDQIGEEDGINLQNPDFADREGTDPLFESCEDQIVRCWQYAEACNNDNHSSWPGAILTTNHDIISYNQLLESKPDRLKASVLTGNYLEDSKVIHLSDLTGAKGFEFSFVIIVGMDQGVFPFEGEAEGELWRSAERLYVAITRARDHLILLSDSHKTPSRFISNIANLYRNRTQGKSS